MSSLAQEITSIINEVCRPDPPDLSDAERSLLEAGLDSLDFATVLMAVEDKFGVQIDEDDLDQVRSLAALCRYVEERTSGG